MPEVVPALELRDVSVTYQGAHAQIDALDHIDLSVDAQEPIALIGPSGCGKTTILNLIAGLLHPSQGEVLIEGNPIMGPRQKTALILQDYGLLPWKSVINNTALGLTFRGVSKKIAHQQALEALETVGLSEFTRAYPSELSGGMRQRVALARAIALDCDVMLMDEPLSALDALTREELQNLLLDLQQKQGYAQVLVTHSIEEAVFLGRTIVLMTPRPGRIRAVIDNAAMGTIGYRQTPEFYEKCAHLRALLVDELARNEACDA